MLLTSPISIHSPPAGCRRACSRCAAVPLPATMPQPPGPLSTRTGMRAPNLFGRDRAPAIACGRGQRLIEVRDDVVDMLDADAEPDHLGPHPGLALLLRRHLPMGGGG